MTVLMSTIINYFYATDVAILVQKKSLYKSSVVEICN